MLSDIKGQLKGESKTGHYVITPALERNRRAGVNNKNNSRYNKGHVYSLRGAKLVLILRICYYLINLIIFK